MKQALAVTLSLKTVDQFFADNTSPYQVWLKMVEWFRRYHPGKLDTQTEGHMDEWTK